MIHLSNGHAFDYMAASGALAYDGRGWPWEWPLRWAGLLDPRLFTIVTKTLTPLPRRGNLRWTHPWSVVAKVPHGAVNAIGLTNPGFEWWLCEVAPQIPKRGYNIVASITAGDPATLMGMAAKLEDVNIRAIEINASCPNTDQELLKNATQVVDMVQAVRRVSRHPLILKLSVVHNYVELARACEDMVEALAINTVPWNVAFPGEKSPLARFGGGGVSGRAAQPWTWKMVRDLAHETKIPVIGPGAWEYSDIARLRELGAKAVSFGSIFMRYPWRPTAFVRRELQS
jgi:dihydroorotate dehydrogenase (NAD+) catalytic subunit